jgi:hypothetical protein
MSVPRQCMKMSVPRQCMLLFLQCSLAYFSLHI